jgi:hypothetical protein
MPGSYSSSLSLHGVRGDDEHSALENSSSNSSPFYILTPQGTFLLDSSSSVLLSLFVVSAPAIHSGAFSVPTSLLHYRCCTY